MGFRAEDDALLQRLEDQSLAEGLLDALVAEVGAVEDARRELPERAGGLVAELRKHPGGREAVAAALAGDLGALARLLDGLALKACPPELLHHVALFYGRAAALLERSDAERAASVWTRSLAAWLALAEERRYLAHLERAVLGPSDGKAQGAGVPPERAPLELLTILARRADGTARDLAPAGRAALLALGATDEAARMAGAPPETARAARVFAERRRNAAVEAALDVVREALEDAHARGELTANGRELLLRAVAVWRWASEDDAVEHFVVDWLDKIGWEHHRARDWGALAELLEPFRPLYESLAARIERDPSQLAYAAPCAQMFVFLAEVETAFTRKRALAERAVRICPTHRNGRLVLASLLCEEATLAMRGMIVVARRGEVARVEALLDRVESLYPSTYGLPEARRMLDRVKRAPLAI